MYLCTGSDDNAWRHLFSDTDTTHGDTTTTAILITLVFQPRNVLYVPKLRHAVYKHFWTKHHICLRGASWHQPTRLHGVKTQTLLTPSSKVLLQKLTVSQLHTKCPAFYASQMSSQHSTELHFTYLINFQYFIPIDTVLFNRGVLTKIICFLLVEWIRHTIIIPLKTENGLNFV
jgi:hypothetical protein